MGLTRLAIRRPLTMLMIILAVVVLGVRSYTLLQVDRLPKSDLPYVTVVVVYPGAAPEDVAERVVKPIEDAVAGVTGLANITAAANENVGAVILEFQQGIDGAQAAMEVDRAVSAIRRVLPEEIQPPSVLQANLSAVPIMQIVLSGAQGADALFELARDDLKPALESVPGVASVNISGGRAREIHVDADPTRLAAYGLPIEALQQALALANVSAPAGSVDQAGQRYAVRSVGRFGSLTDIEDTIVAGGPSPIPLPEGLLPKAPSGMDTSGLVYLRDVAAVDEDRAEAARLVRYNGRDGVLLKIVKTADANAIQVADAVRERLGVAAFQSALPPGASADVVVDDSKFTRQAVAGVQEDLILAILITGLVMLLFLHTIRSTVIVLLAIPTSIIATFLVMWALGFSLNTLTLLALTLTIGILVDDSIVVLENIERHLHMGKPAAQAALDGRSEIGLAAITITLVDVVVYLPVAFTSGIIGQFFRSYGLTIVAATLFSLLVSFTLTPMLAARWLRPPAEERPEPRGTLRGRIVALPFRPIGWLWGQFCRAWDAAFAWLIRFYGAILRLVLRNPFTQSLVVLIAAGALAAGIWLVVSGVVPSEFVPYQDDGQITVTLKMPAGSNLATTDQAVQRMERIIRTQVPETAAILTTVGTSGGDFLGTVNSPNAATILVQLVDRQDRRRSTGDVVAALRPLLAAVPDADAFLNVNALISAMPTGVYIQVHGPDQDALHDLARQVEAVVKHVPGVKDIRSDAADRAPETRILVDRDRAKELGLSPGQIAYTLRLALTGNAAGTYKPEGAERPVDIVLRADDATRADLDRILDLPLGYLSGQQVRLGQVATVAQAQAPGSISRANRENTLTVTAGGSGRGDADMANAIEAALKSQVAFPPGYGYTLAGATEVQRDSFSQLSQALALSILLIYMLLVALYQSWLQPLAIMFSLPVALVGAFGGLLVTGNTLNTLSLLGVIMLAGIVTKNAILIVDFTNVLRRDHGYARKDALVTAGRLRLRPILMTTAAIVFALSPLLFGQGAGAEIRAPLAAVVIGGNITSTLLTLILVPVVYNAFDAGGEKVRRAFRRLFAAPQEPVATPALHTEVETSEVASPIR